MSWTPERIATLKRLWREGHSSTDIATELGGVTRNAVIGKVHRLGLEHRSIPSSPVKVRKRRKRVSPAPKNPHSGPETGRQRAGEGFLLPEKPEVQERAQRARERETAFVRNVDIIGLQAGQCKWPVTDEPPHLFCGCKAVPGEPYCRQHLLRSISPLSEATLKRPAVSLKVAMS